MHTASSLYKYKPAFDQQNLLQSSLKNKLHSYQLQIRSHQISKFKQDKRHKIITINTIEELLKQLPFDNLSSQRWAEELTQLYAQASFYTLRYDKGVQLFRVFQTFPNKNTLQLFQVVVIKSDRQGINEIFQYNVMKLLHAFIIYVNDSAQQKPVTCEKITNILKDTTFNNQTVLTIANNLHTQELQVSNRQDQHLHILKAVLRIIAEICRKSDNARNFVILNHSSYTYWLKSYKLFGEQIKTQFMALLEAATFHPIARHEQQFQRIINLIANNFYKCHFDCNLNNPTQLQNDQWLLMAFINLFKMKCAWTNTTIRMHGIQQLLSKIISMLQRYADATSITTLKQQQPAKILSEAVNLAIYFLELFEYIDNKRQIQCLYVELIGLLYKIYNYPQLCELRRSIYFIFSNFFVEPNIQNDFICQILFLGNSNEPNLMSLLANLFLNETNGKVIYQLCYLLHSILQNIPQEIVPKIQSMFSYSNIVSIAMSKLVQLLSWGSDQDPWQDPSKNILTEALTCFMTRIGPNIQGTQQLQQMLYSQFGQKIINLINTGFCSPKLAQKLQILLKVLQQFIIPCSL